MGCFQENQFAANAADMEVLPIVEITTPFPPITDEEMPLEDYPDYMLPNDEYTDKLKEVNNLFSIKKFLVYFSKF